MQGLKLKKKKSKSHASYNKYKPASPLQLKRVLKNEDK